MLLIGATSNLFHSCDPVKDCSTKNKTHKKGERNKKKYIIQKPEEEGKKMVISYLGHYSFSLASAPPTTKHSRLTLLKHKRINAVSICRWCVFKIYLYATAAAAAAATRMNAEE